MVVVWERERKFHAKREKKNCTVVHKRGEDEKSARPGQGKTQKFHTKLFKTSKTVGKKGLGKTMWKKNAALGSWGVNRSTREFDAKKDKRGAMEGDERGGAGETFKLSAPTDGKRTRGACKTNKAP